MDMTYNDYLMFMNHLFIERMMDEDFITEIWKNEEGQDGAQTIDAMTIIE